jgi:hypothetical protein
MKFLSKVKHEASPCLPSLYFCKRLVHLLESAYFRDHLGFSCRLELKRLSQIDSIPKNRSHYFDNACHDVKNRKCTCWSAGSPTNTAVPPRRRDPKGLFKCFRRNSCAIVEGCSSSFSIGLANKSLPDGRKIPRSLRRVTGEGDNGCRRTCLLRS